MIRVSRSVTRMLVLSRSFVVSGVVRISRPPTYRWGCTVRISVVTTFIRSLIADDGIGLSRRNCVVRRALD